MFDLHVHLLPGVDDGPGDWPAALALARLMAAAGVRTAVATAHQMPDGPYRPAVGRLRALTAELKERLASEGTSLAVLPGAEVRLTLEVPRLLAAGQLLTLGDAHRAVLVELPPDEVPRWAEHVLFEIQVQGFVPLVAHPERNWGLIADLKSGGAIVQRWMERGIRLQVNAGSLLGHSGRRAAQAAQMLLASGWAHALASDAHSTGWRPPNLAAGRQAALEAAGERAAHLLTVEWPARLMAGAPVSSVLPVERVRRRRWWQEFLSGCGKRKNTI